MEPSVSDGARTAPGPGVFDRVLCGVDGSNAGLEAARQSARLLAPDGELVLVSVCETHRAVHAGIHAGEAERELEAAARRALAEAQELTGHARLELAHGRAPETLADLAAGEGATVVAVGAQGFGRAAGIVLGSIATRLLHGAPCSVLIAREPAEPQGFPRAIAVGIDGSAHSLAAAETATGLGERFGVPVRYLVATGGKPLDVDGLAGSGYDLEYTRWRPVDALVGVSDFVDLVVVGSRGLHGVAALGSVSERAAHKARASVLVVRSE